MKNPDKNIEVELRAIVKSLEGVKKKIEKEGAKFVGSSSLHDIYFCNKAFSRVEQAEMHEVGSYSLRLRQYSKGKKESITLNTKSITKQGDHHAWEEHETEVTNFSEAARILVATEFRPFFELKKTRYEYSLGELNIFIEDIEDFGGAVEIEIMTSLGHEDNAKAKITEFLSSVGVSSKEIVPKSVTNIVMKQRAFKSKISL